MPLPAKPVKAPSSTASLMCMLTACWAPRVRGAEWVTYTLLLTKCCISQTYSVPIQTRSRHRPSSRSAWWSARARGAARRGPLQRSMCHWPRRSDCKAVTLMIHGVHTHTLATHTYCSQHAHRPHTHRNQAPTACCSAIVGCMGPPPAPSSSLGGPMQERATLSNRRSISLAQRVKESAQKL